MYITNFDDVITQIESINNSNYEDFFMVAVNAFPVEKIFIQQLIREINGEKKIFLSIRDVKIQDTKQKQKVFSKILDSLESKNIPIMIDDIINDKLDAHLMKRGYLPLIYKKNNSSIRSRYRLGK